MLDRSVCLLHIVRREFNRVVIIITLVTTNSSPLLHTSTPNFEKGEPSGPIQKGMTYIVRPFIHPLKRSSSIECASVGSIQLFVGPASCVKAP